jgi:regulator of protease activity HflC (stomatin/prohibitin superfamily)
MQQQTLMQLDSLEMQRRSQLAIISGEKEAEQILMEARTGAQVARAQGRAAEIKGYTQAASTLASGYLTYG